MFVIRKAWLNEIEAAIANALVDAVDHHGRPATAQIGTIDPAMRQAAALAAVTMACGQPCVPQDHKITVEDEMPLIFTQRQRRQA